MAGLKIRKEVMHEETRPQQSNIERYHPDPSLGLTEREVQMRIQQGLNNGEQGMKTKTEGQIIRENVLTFFNVLNIILGVFLALVGSFADMGFVLVIFWNALIGSFQGIRSKRTIDKLSLIAAPQAEVIRNGAVHKVPVSGIVLDDVMLLNAGNQICSDCAVLHGEIEVNESLITGEADPITKSPGDHLLSGSFVVSGSCSAQVEHVGAENYAAKITNGAKYVKKRTSEIMGGIDKIIKIVGFAVIPVGIILFIKQHYILMDTFRGSVTGTVSAIVGMIPEGLILLTSVVFAVSVIRLSAHKTLVQDLYCVETLARVDTLCLDKTGTITEGTMQVDEILPFEGCELSDVSEALQELIRNLKDQNPTFQAVQGYLSELSDSAAPDEADKIVPFSSARKWSGVYFHGRGCIVMGAGEFILGPRFSEIQQQSEYYSSMGQRVLLVASSSRGFGSDDSLPADMKCIGLVVISDKLRREAPRTLRYFADQGVDIKIISGDNAVTVSNIAKKAGLETAGQYVDATTLESDADISRAVRENAVFGRVTPQQKLAFVRALKDDGHTVAMTGDGVNDVLALKESDCSIAMASGSDAARTVSSLVLLDSNFASMPKIVAEGRRSINNLQRSAALFLSKTIFFALIGVIFIFLDYTYPFLPRQQTLINILTVGIPSFVLALEPNHERLKGHFLSNIFRLSIPAGLSMTASTLVLCALGSIAGITDSQLSTLIVLSTAFVAFLLLFQVCAPFNALRGTLFSLMLTGFVLAILFFGDMFELVALTLPMIILLIFTFVLSAGFMVAAVHFTNNILIGVPGNVKSRRGKNSVGKRRGRI